MKVKIQSPLINHIEDPFAQYIFDAYQAKKIKNPKYSIRAFANFLDVDHSLLSKTLKGKHGLSLKLKLHSLEKLGAGSEIITKCLLAIQKENYWNEVSDREFEFMSDWKYSAILELLTIPGFNGTNKKIAEKLNISNDESNRLINNLIEMKLLDSSDNKLVPSSLNNTTIINTNRSNEAKTIFQKAILLKSLSSLENDPIETRDHTCVILALDENDIILYKEWIKNARRQLTKLFQKSKEFNSVYTLQMSLFPVIKQGKN